MPPESPRAGSQQTVDELPATRRKALYAFAIGRQNTERYLRVFERFDTKRGLAGVLSWNWGAFFCTLPWLAYRRMPGLAVIYFMLGFVLAPLQISAWQQSCPGDRGIPYVVIMAWLPFTFLLMPAVADRLYYRRVRRIAMEAYARRTQDTEEAPGTSMSSAVKFAIGGPLVFLVLFSQFGSFHLVSHETQLSDALQPLNTAKSTVAAFHAERGRLPSKGEIEPLASTAQLKSITVGDSGVITAVTAVRCFEGQSIIYTPTVANGRLSWKCSTPDIDLDLVPPECRQRN